MTHYAGIIRDDMANGPGIRLSVFFSGCELHCKGCHNQDLWDRKYGVEFTQETISNILVELEKPTYQGLSILGGEPFAPYNLEAVYNLVRQFRAKFKDTKNLWIWTGFQYEHLKELFYKAESEQQKQEGAYALNILHAADTIVDGPYVEWLKERNLKFRGSTNQRIIEVKQS